MGNSSSKVKYRVILLGLDGAGKTTIFKSINSLTNIDIPDEPTITPNVSTHKIGHTDIMFWDMAGQESFRSFWRQYYTGTGIIIFVVDSSDIERLDKARSELEFVLREYELRSIPVLVLANKRDVHGAYGKEQVSQALQVDRIAPRKSEVLSISAQSRNEDEIRAILDWIRANAIKPEDIPRHNIEFDLLVEELQQQQQSQQRHSQNESQNE